jgi:hypothetical protein
VKIDNYFQTGRTAFICELILKEVNDVTSFFFTRLSVNVFNTRFNPLEKNNRKCFMNEKSNNVKILT